MTTLAGGFLVTNYHDGGHLMYLMYLMAINQALPYGCSFVTYGHPEGSAAGDIIIIWNDVFK